MGKDSDVSDSKRHDVCQTHAILTTHAPHPPVSMIARPVSLTTLAMSAIASLTGISMIIGMGLFILTHILFILAGHSTYEFIKLGVCVF